MSNRRKFLGQVGGVTAVAVAGPLVAGAALDYSTVGHLSEIEQEISRFLIPHYKRPSGREHFEIQSEVIDAKTVYFETFFDGPFGLHNRPFYEREQGLHIAKGSNLLRAEGYVSWSCHRYESSFKRDLRICEASKILVAAAQYNYMLGLPFNTFWTMRDQMPKKSPLGRDCSSGAEQLILRLWEPKPCMSKGVFRVYITEDPVSKCPTVRIVDVDGRVTESRSILVPSGDSRVRRTNTDAIWAFLCEEKDCYLKGLPRCLSNEGLLMLAAEWNFLATEKKDAHIGLNFPFFEYWAPRNP